MSTAVDIPEVVTGVERFVWELSPSWPKSFSPVHFTSPVDALTTQVCQSPAETHEASEVNPDICTGLKLSVFNPSPSWPYPPDPQHLTPPPLKMAHACVDPAVIFTTPEM